jgi:dipeptidase E
MKLLLCSQTLNNDSLRDALRGMLDKPAEECNFVYIPTAANTARNNGWLVRDMYEIEKLGWKSFSTLDLAVVASWPKNLWWQTIEEADVIMVGGGNSGYLSYWMYESGLAQKLPELLKTKVYVGSSAGSMFMTPGQASSSGGLKNAPSYEFPLDDPEVPKGQIRRQTLNLVPFLFRPHWHASTAPDVTEEITQKAANDLKMPIYLVDDQTAIKVVDDDIEVISEGEWKLLEASL